MAPANRASIAEGPALKLVHCTLTCGPIAFSNHPLALPTMAWACVTLGKAPTRMVLAVPCAHPVTAVTSPNIRIAAIRLSDAVLWEVVIINQYVYRSNRLY